MKRARRWRFKEEQEEDIQIAQRIIADVKALLTCVPYLISAPLTCILFPSAATIDTSHRLLFRTSLPPIGRLVLSCRRGDGLTHIQLH